MKLRAFEGYYDLSPEDKQSICNGAGAAGDWRSRFIPNTLYGLDCTEVFNIHDYAYEVGVAAEDKKLADIQMLINLMTVISDADSFVMLAYARRARAVKYYMAVHRYGDDAFYA